VLFPWLQPKFSPHTFEKSDTTSTSQKTKGWTEIPRINEVFGIWMKTWGFSHSFFHLKSPFFSLTVHSASHITVSDTVDKMFLRAAVVVGRHVLDARGLFVCLWFLFCKLSPVKLRFHHRFHPQSSMAKCICLFLFFIKIIIFLYD
jgi:hypothetical protein